MKFFLALLLGLSAVNVVFADSFKDLVSPDGKIRVKINYDKKITYEVFYENKQLVFPSVIDLILADGKTMSASGGIKKISFTKNNTVIVSPVPEKRKNIPDVYNEMQIRLRSSFAVIFRAYNDGVAFRITTAFKDSVTITNEIAQFSFAPETSAYYSQVAGGREDIFHTSFEEEYHHHSFDSITSDMLLFNPLVLAPPAMPEVAINESDGDKSP
jgi:alpha-glucosidase